MAFNFVVVPYSTDSTLTISPGYDCGTLRLWKVIREDNTIITRGYCRKHNSSAPPTCALWMPLDALPACPWLIKRYNYPSRDLVPLFAPPSVLRPSTGCLLLMVTHRARTGCLQLMVTHRARTGCRKHCHCSYIWVGI